MEFTKKRIKEHEDNLSSMLEKYGIDFKVTKITGNDLWRYEEVQRSLYWLFHLLYIGRGELDYRHMDNIHSYTTTNVFQLIDKKVIAEERQSFVAVNK